MSEYPLIPREELLRVKSELYQRINQLIPNVDLEGEEIGEALAWSLLFEYWPDLLSGFSVDSENAFYNRYFWFKRFATIKQEQDGYDAGLEQQVFNLLEQPDFDLDWPLIEQLDTEAATLS